MPRTRQARRCSAHRRDGSPCRAYAINGGHVCRMHGGSAPQVKAKAAERVTRAKAWRMLARLVASPAWRERREYRQQALGDAFLTAAEIWERSQHQDDASPGGTHETVPGPRV